MPAHLVKLLASGSKKLQFWKRKNCAELFSCHTIWQKIVNSKKKILFTFFEFWVQIFFVRTQKSWAFPKFSSILKFWNLSWIVLVYHFQNPKKIKFWNFFKFLSLKKFVWNFEPKISIFQNIFCGTNWHTIYFFEKIK